jgi:hypothetical protein
MDESLPSYGYYDESNISGRSDYGSGAGVLDYLKWGGGTATGLLGVLKNSKADTAPPTTGQANWGLIAGIGAAFLVVLVLIVSLGRR